MQRPNVLVAILTRETVTTKWAANHRNMQLPHGSSVSYLSGMPFGHARNSAAQSTLDHGFEWLMFVDDDVCLPADAIPRLMSHGKDIVSGVYYRRALPIQPVMLKYKPDGKEAEWITAWNPPGVLIEVDLVGAGCLLIHRRVLERMPKPWFIWELEPEVTKYIRAGMGTPESDPVHSEDFSFCRNAKRLHGLKVFVDTSIICEHVGYGSSREGGVFVPANA